MHLHHAHLTNSYTTSSGLTYFQFTGHHTPVNSHIQNHIDLWLFCRSCASIGTQIIGCWISVLPHIQWVEMQSLARPQLDNWWKKSHHNSSWSMKEGEGEGEGEWVWELVRKESQSPGALFVFVKVVLFIFYLERSGNCLFFIYIFLI